MPGSRRLHRVDFLGLTHPDVPKRIGDEALLLRNE
jgi:hypothetical protein